MIRSGLGRICVVYESVMRAFVRAHVCMYVCMYLCIGPTAKYVRANVTATW